MSLHIIKLCVGVSEIDELRHWQDRRLREHEEIFHITRMAPKRADEILDGGSLYWVIKGLHPGAPEDHRYRSLHG